LNRLALLPSRIRLQPSKDRSAHHCHEQKQTAAWTAFCADLTIVGFSCICWWLPCTKRRWVAQRKIVVGLFSCKSWANNAPIIRDKPMTRLCAAGNYVASIIAGTVAALNCERGIA
jgi:hypothetical protein